LLSSYVESTPVRDSISLFNDNSGTGSRVAALPRAAIGVQNALSTERNALHDPTADAVGAVAGAAVQVGGAGIAIDDTARPPRAADKTAGIVGGAHTAATLV
jgi:hypothetical protein